MIVTPSWGISWQKDVFRSSLSAAKHVLALSSAFNSKGYHPPHVVHPEKCSGCDLCGMYCPDFAIYGTKSDGKSAEIAKAEKATGGAK